MQLDPSPIETPPAADVDKELPSIPADEATDDSTSTIKPASTTSAPGLSQSLNGSSSSIYYRTSGRIYGPVPRVHTTYTYAGQIL